MQRNEKPKQDISQKLKAAIEHKNGTFVIGSGNKASDLLRTNAWAFLSVIRYSGLYKKITQSYSNAFDAAIFDNKFTIFRPCKKWIFNKVGGDRIVLHRNHYAEKNNLDPLNDKEFKLSEEHRFYLLEAMVARAIRSGNCAKQSAFICKFFWENPAGIKRIELISFGKLVDHFFVIINREGELNNSQTWGDAWIIDPWYQSGWFFHAKNFKENIKEIIVYLNNQNKEREDIFQSGKEIVYKLEDIEFISKMEIVPGVNPYPRYSTDKIIDDHYEVIPKELENDLIFLKNNKDKFDKCVKEIQGEKPHDGLKHKN